MEGKSACKPAAEADPAELDKQFLESLGAFTCCSKTENRLLFIFFNVMNDSLRLCWRWVPLIQLQAWNFFFDPSERGKIYSLLNVSSKKEMSN